jgi:hypothetical protein
MTLACAAITVHRIPKQIIIIPTTPPIIEGPLPGLMLFIC